MDISKKSNYKLILILVLLFFICFYCLFSQFFTTSRKYAKDYSAIDILRAHKIALGYIIPTKEMILKYDINEDGKINDADVKIIQQMVLGFYDCYEVTNDGQKAIKYVCEKEGKNE